ncbi:MAG: hypothetical protein QUU85_09605, partial [Candidatus Eisenbacteria bacterium]|nr:hypothetical protein [Candidatus Eisenbacteria bacterium]
MPPLICALFLAYAAVGGADAARPAKSVDPPSTPPIPASLPDIETFLQIGAASNPEITRDGSRLFFVTSQTGTAQVYRLTDEGWPYQLTFFPNGIGDYTVSPDGRTIAVTAATGGSERYQIYLLDAESGLARPATQQPEARFGLPVFSPDGRTIYFAGNPDSPADFHIYAQDVSTCLLYTSPS